MKDKLLFMALTVLAVVTVGGTVVYLRAVEANKLRSLQQVSQVPGIVAEQDKPVKPPEVSDIDMSVLFSETNKARSQNGAPRLSLNPGLNDSATGKCLDLVKRDYWSHNAPDGVEPWVFIEQHVDGYTKAGENLAYGFVEASSVVEGWLASHGHRENIVNEQYTDVGFAVCKSDNFIGKGQRLIIVQHFIGQ
jgi:uncharacterized protein YkwD